MCHEVVFDSTSYPLPGLSGLPMMHSWLLKFIHFAVGHPLLFPSILPSIKAQATPLFCKHGNVTNVSQRTKVVLECHNAVYIILMTGASSCGCCSGCFLVFHSKITEVVGIVVHAECCSPPKLQNIFFVPDF